MNSYLLRPLNACCGQYAINPSSNALRILNRYLQTGGQEETLELFATRGAWSVFLKHVASHRRFTVHCTEHFSKLLLNEKPSVFYSQPTNFAPIVAVKEYPRAERLIIFNLPEVGKGKERSCAATALRAFRGRTLIFARQWDAETKEFLGEPSFHREVACSWKELSVVPFGTYTGRRTELVYAVRQSLPAKSIREMTVTWRRSQRFIDFLDAHQQAVRSEVEALAAKSSVELMKALETAVSGLQHKGFFTEDWFADRSSTKALLGKHSQLYLEEWIECQHLRVQFAPILPRDSDIKKLCKFIGNDKILHIEAGFGLWVRLLRDAGIKATATDAFNFHRAKAPTYTPVLCCDNGAAPLACSDHNVMMLMLPPGAKKIPQGVEALSEFEGEKIIFFGELPEDRHSINKFFGKLLAEWLPESSWEYRWLDPLEYGLGRVYCLTRKDEST